LSSLNLFSSGEKRDIIILGSRLVERFFPQVFEKYLVNILVPVIESELTVFEVKIKG